MSYGSAHVMSVEELREYVPMKLAEIEARKQKELESRRFHAFMMEVAESMRSHPAYPSGS